MNHFRRDVYVCASPTRSPVIWIDHIAADKRSVVCPGPQEVQHQVVDRREKMGLTSVAAQFRLRLSCWCNAGAMIQQRSAWVPNTICRKWVWVKKPACAQPGCITFPHNNRD